MTSSVGNMACSGISFGASEGDLGSGEQMAACVTGTQGVTSVLEEVTTDNGTGSDINILDEYTLGHLLSFLPMDDLKNCRLVNSYWNQTSNREIMKRNYLIEFSNWDEDIEHIHGLIQLIQNTSKFPLTKFKVNAEGPKTEENKQQVVNLFREIAHFVTDIQLEDLKVEMELLPEDVELPALRNLTLDYIYDEESDDDVTPSERNRKYAVGIVKQAPKLDVLTLEGVDMMPMFMAILKTPNCRKITRFSVFSNFESEHFLELSEMGFQLKYLKLLLASLSIVSTDSLQTFLLSQSSSLEEFELESYDEEWASDHFKLKLPRMDKLKVLMVPDAQLYSEISYKNQFQALKKLMFGVQSSDSLDSFFNDDIDPVETLEELDFDDIVVPPGRILQAARQFPKLRKITLKPNRNRVNCLGLAMINLKEVCFKATGVNDLDAILTGFSEDVEALKDLPDSQLEMLERYREPLPFLKNLTRLRLEGGWSNLRELKLSDFACRFALMKMEHLRILEISGKCQISEPVMEAMKKKFTVRM